MRTRSILYQNSLKKLEAVASLMWRNFSLLNIDRLIGCTYWSMPNIPGSFATERFPKLTNVWIDFLLTRCLHVFNVLPANLLDHLTNAELKDCAAPFSMQFISSYNFLFSILLFFFSSQDDVFQQPTVHTTKSCCKSN